MFSWFPKQYLFVKVCFHGSLIHRMVFFAGGPALDPAGRLCDWPLGLDD